MKLLNIIFLVFFGTSVFPWGKPPVSMQNYGKGVYEASCMIETSVSTPAVWRLLCDYDGFTDVVSSLKLSKKVQTVPDILVEQIGQVKIFFTHRQFRVLLKVLEKPSQSIEFEDISKKDFHEFHGSWEIKNTQTGTVVVYRVRAKPRLHAPGFVIKKTMKSDVSQMMQNVLAEIQRRGAESR